MENSKVVNRVLSGVALAAATIALATSTLSWAQTYPARPVRFVLTAPAGNPLDTATRLIGSKLSAQWGQPVIVDNRPGGNLIIGTELVVKSPADGYTFLGTNAALAQNPALIKLPYDTQRDLAPVTQFFTLSILYVADAKLQVNTLGEFIKLAKANPGKFNYGTTGNATVSHLIGAKLNHDAKIGIVHVPYKGAAAAILALLAGDVSTALVDRGSARPHLESGRIKLLALTGAKRSSFFPDTPTFDEAGVPGFDIGLWAGYFAPAGTPDAVLNKVAQDVGRILSSPDVLTWYKEQGLEPAFNTPAQFREIVRKDIEYWANIVRTTGIKLD